VNKMTLKECLKQMPKDLTGAFCDFCHKLEEVSNAEVDVESVTLDQVWSTLTDMVAEEGERKS